MRDTAGPVTNLNVYAYISNSTSLFYVSTLTGTNGAYALSVTNGTWVVGLQGVTERGYNPAATQQTTIDNSNSVVNFLLQPFSGALYSISVSANPPGVGTVTGGGNYLPGAAVTVTATLSPTNTLPYSFLNWTENDSVQTTNTTYSFTASRDRQLVANFTLPQYTVSAFNAPPADGSVTGTGAYFYGTTNSLTAYPNAGYNFSYWGLDAFYQFSSGGAYDTQYPFSFPCTMTKGETMDFIVSCHDGDYSYLGTGLKAAVTYSNGASSNVYDAVAGFSSNANPGAVWSYGWASNVGGAFQLMDTNYSLFSGSVAGWDNGLPYPGVAAVDKDFGSAMQSGTVAYDPDTLHMDPQSYASIVRFTAPSNGSYDVAGFFRLQDTSTHSHDLTIMLGNNDISTNPTISVVVYSNLSLVAYYVDAVPEHFVTTATSPSGLAVVSGAGSYGNGLTADIVAPTLVTNGPSVYVFRYFTLNGSEITTSSSISKTFTTLDPANLSYVAVYTARSVRPVVTRVEVNLPNIVPATTNFQISFQFDRTMNTNVDPTVLLTNNATVLQPTVESNGLWSTTSFANDTYTAPRITFVKGMDGTNQVFISNAQDPSGNILSLTNVYAVVVDATPPVISNVTNSPSITSANVTWTTDKPATSQVDYGPTTNYGFTTAFDGTLVNNHLQEITGLNPSTLYHYRVISQDSVGNQSVSPDATLSTLVDTIPPHTFITSGPAQNATVCSLPVIFVWSASDAVTPTSNLVYAYRLDGGSYSAFSNVTTVTYTTLSDGIHSFQVEAQDQAGNVDPTPATVLFTLSTLAPVISAVNTTGVTNAQATVNWNTDQPATSAVEYGPTTNYGTTTGLIGALVTSHSYLLTGLTPGQTYHYAVLSQNSCAEASVSGDFVFTVPADHVPPQTFLTGGPSEGGFVCSLPVVFDWSGSDPVTPTANLTYAYSVDGGAFSAFSLATTVSLSALTQGEHSFAVEAKDQAGNVSPTPATVQFTVNTNSGPAISGITNSASPGQCIISWNTDQPSTSQVNYGLTVAYGSTSALDASFVTNHSVTLNTLIPDTNYHFQVISSNQCNRQSVSADNTFFSPPVPNLAVMDITGPAAASTGSSFDISWVTTNIGTAAASNVWMDDVYLCNSTNPCETYDLGQFQFPIGLAAGAGTTVTHSVTVDRSMVTNGNYYLTVVVNANRAVYEGLPSSPAWNNNTGVSAKPILISLTPLPELVISQVDAPTNPVYAGDSITVDWVECNAGQAATSVPLWYDDVSLYADSNLTQLVQDYGAYPNVTFLSPGQCYEQSVDITLPGGLEGPYYVKVTADSENQVQQSNGGRNYGYTTNPVPVLYVAPGFFHVVSVTVTPGPPTVDYEGYPLTVNYTIENTGGVPIVGHWDHGIAICPGPVWDGDTAQVAVFHINGTNGADLLPGQSYSETYTFGSLRSEPAGTNYVVVLPDPHPYQPTVSRDQGYAPIIVGQPPPAALDVPLGHRAEQWRGRPAHRRELGRVQ